MQYSTKDRLQEFAALVTTKVCAAKARDGNLDGDIMKTGGNNEDWTRRVANANFARGLDLITRRDVSRGIKDDDKETIQEMGR